MGVPTLFLIVAGLFPSLVVVGGPSLGSLLTMPGVLGGVLWAIMLACGGLLAWQEGLLRSRIGLLFGAVHDVLRLEWLYVSVAGAFDRGLSIFRAVNDVVEGAGALLWSLLLFLLLLLAWGGL